MKAFLFIFLCFGLVGCNQLTYSPAATGPEGEVFVIADSESWSGRIGNALRSTLGEEVQTLPVPESRFKLTHAVLESQPQFEQLKKNKSIIFAASLADTSSEANFVRSAFSEEALEVIASGEGSVIPRKNMWRQNQDVFFAVGADAEKTAEAILQAKDLMLSTIETSARMRVEADMFDSKRQFDLEERIEAKHGFRVKVQHDYQIAVDTTNFVYLRRVLTDTWRNLFIYYEDGADPSKLTPEWIYQVRDSLGRQYMRGNLDGFVQIARNRPLESRNIDFKGNFAYETRGIWEMYGEDAAGDVVQYGMGGPFVTYTFYDQNKGRIYMIDGMIFAPGFAGKKRFLHQMEVIAHTFSSGESQIASAGL